MLAYVSLVCACGCVLVGVCLWVCVCKLTPVAGMGEAEPAGTGEA